ncbi:BZ3500_MvSof-1268-A1-R1_Chr7-1g09109 [Microbotryum saponariae]|uniref:BZ3500_MvSof-1268-A1-R1_Chr7-1g09109 protein n=1 Tax=Microbotryum saponariae TaxID=289078 RepID=A0A2X0KVW0_9BASI|nr:BZ3501_MvSof-1269-A2-R1_Chr7-1g08814 [Microbotryum saponariae]SDA02819.1 BZ3500_MvSof-1268-A1-R1_Chr7-1g09109 [Microbotryum saponariae]
MDPAPDPVAQDSTSISGHSSDQPPPPSYASLVAPVPRSSSLETANATAQSSISAHSIFPNHAAFDHSQAALGFPSGYFILRNRGAGGRVLDLLGHKTNEGALIGLHPLKQPQVDGDQLQYRANNQLWFIGWDGLLYNGALTLAYPHPVMSIPSHRSHPTPQFVFDPVTSTLRVQYATDPTFPGPRHEDKSDWNDYDYIVESVPQRRKRPNQQGLWDVVSSGPGNIFEGLSEKIFGTKNPSSEVSNPLAGPGPSGSPSRPPSMTSQAPIRPAYETYRRRSSSNTNTNPPLLPARPRTVEVDSDSDSEPSASRSVRVVAVPRSLRYGTPSQSEPSTKPMSGSLYQGGLDPSHAAGDVSHSSGQTLEIFRRERAREARRSKRRQWELVSVVVRPVPIESYSGRNSFSETERAMAGSPSSSSVMRRGSSTVGLSSSPRFIPLPTSPSLDRTEPVRTRRALSNTQQLTRSSITASSSSYSIASQGFSLPRLLKANIYGKYPDESEASGDTINTEGSDLFDDEPEDARVLQLDEIGQEMARSTSNLSLSEPVGSERQRAGRMVEGLQIEQQEEVTPSSLRAMQLDRPLPEFPSMEELSVLATSGTEEEDAAHTAEGRRKRIAE